MAAEEKYRVIFRRDDIEKHHQGRTKRRMAKKFRLNREKAYQFY